ncbi:hypothetical protein F11_08245 [Rhodospirillum rubrum F11]|uniref:UDP-2,3-diacylglucosamine pyrophosphatase n=2 Tax=Rhodospirillum rubrum TaxID=1085 RepID=Q2RTZ7_RHORT|nr:UDP-2,3-diacylglucosamine diphosphatase LpxI [Rhodospirillum rubrum]ABC22398.1 Protein of unknown function DUF1009 [Rhodospirillum rubrum ATCC 11170]AEO48115.1 hypothetical protein F11_08245 [Rhodospirillum rubrum F11]MBK5953979.1 UDP-2,3-diacylglucosamine pyrophosphatase [Rhodospirillum rubrum]QXG82034.1 UDP-2,3-diacylglucosamine diphosphatase LpxI [Rhodospirillum rubrum]HCF17412.1 DUF1009 domain-containing protein [Rhodospirillum rubrum]
MTPASARQEQSVLAIIAGGGDLPKRVVEACQAQGRPFVVVGLNGQAETTGWPPGVPHQWTRLGKCGGMAEDLRDRGILHLCMAGRVKRPSLVSLLPDWRTAAFLAKVGAAALGDDGLLSAIVRELESNGFTIEAPDQVIGARPLGAGVIGRIVPDDQARRDLAHAFRMAKALGALDIGQGVVVQQGLVLAVEAIEGTDAMLERCACLLRDGPGAVLVKACKPQQDRRVDLPALGARTLEVAARAGLRGVGFEAGAVVLLDPAGLGKRADDLGLFFVGLSAEGEVPS